MNDDASKMLDMALRNFKTYPEFKEDIAEIYYHFGCMLSSIKAGSTKATEMLEKLWMSSDKVGDARKVRHTRLEDSPYVNNAELCFYSLFFTLLWVLILCCLR
jgi:hypothetical protein